MTAAPSERLATLAELAALPPGSDRDRAVQDRIHELLGDALGDDFSRRRIRDEVVRLKLMPARTFDALAKRVDRLDAAADGRQGDEDRAGAPPRAPLPAEMLPIPGSPGWHYRPASGDYPGEVGQSGRGGYSAVLGWAPAVPRFLETPAPDGNGATAYYYEIAAGGRSVLASGDELALGEPWKLLPVTGTGAKRVREVLANVVLAEAARLPIGRALARTGWHRADRQGGEGGELYYVHADGRTSDGREVVLVGRHHYARLAAAARAAEFTDPAEIAAAIERVIEYGRGPALAGLGVGVRALGHSLHKVPGGFIAIGRPNAGKSSLGWHARLVSVAREGRADAWPPLPSATFADTRTRIEGALDYEADMPTLIDDAALSEKSTRAETGDVIAKLEMIFRALANDAEVRGRMDRTMLPRDPSYVRSPVIATMQGSVTDIPIQNSLLRRVVLLPVARGDIDTAWYRKPGNAAGLVAPLRALGEHLVITYLAVLGDRAPAYLAARDAEAREMLAAALEVIMPGWEDNAEGLAGVADIAACALSGLLIACAACNLAPESVTPAALAYLASAIAAQAARMGESAEAASPREAVAEILRTALLDRRAHVRDHEGEPAAVVPGLTEQEQGLESLADKYGNPIYRGRGAPLWWLPAEGALAVRPESLHALVRAAADIRLPSLPAQSLPAYLVREGVALANPQKRGNRQKRIGGEPMRLVYLAADILAPPVENGECEGATGATGATAQVDDTESNDTRDTITAEGATAQVMSDFPTAPPPSRADCNRSENLPDIGGSSGNTLAPERVLQTTCTVCGKALAPWLIEHGAPWHVICAPDDEFAAVLGGRSPRGAADVIRHLALVPAPAPAAAEAPEAAPIQPPRRGPAPALDEGTTVVPAPGAPGRRRWIVLGGDGRAYAAGGEIVTLPEGTLEGCRGNVGELAALGESLGVLGDPAGTVYVPSAAREALGLPAVLSGELSKWGDMPHLWVESLDTARWHVPEGAGLSRWLVVARRAASGERTYQQVAIAFPEWIEAAPDLAALAPAELAAALELVHLGTTYGGNGRGGVEFARSPATTFARMLDKRLRWSRKGRPEAVELPPPYRRERPARGAPAPMRPPGMHVAPPAEVPEGWTVARLDVRSCYPSAGIGTDFGIGEAEHRQGGELGKRPGAYLVRLPGGSSVHESLTAFVPAAASARGREVLAWLDGHAARWLAECGVPGEVIESWTWPESQRVFASVDADLTEARNRYRAGASAPELAAAAVLKSMPNAFLGGWLASDFGGERRADDWRARYDWWLAIKTQAEVRKQRNLVPAIRSGAIRVLASQAIDSVYVAAESLAAIESMPGSGGRLAVADGNGKFKLEAHALVTGELAAVLAAGKGAGRDRLAAIKAALGEGK